MCNKFMVEMNPRKACVFLLTLYPFVFGILEKLCLPYSGYIDEFLIILLLTLQIFKCNDIFNADKYTQKYLFLIILWMIFGLTPAITRHVSLHILIQGAFLHTKNYLLFFLVFMINWKYKDVKKVVKWLGFIYIFIILCAYIMYFIPSTQIFESTYMTSVFSHPGSFATLCVPVGIYAFVKYINEGNKKYLILFGLIGICLLLAETIKNFISLFFVCVIYFCKAKEKRKYMFVLISLISIIIVSPQIYRILQEEIFVNILSESAPNRPRWMLWRTGFKIAKDFFPIGSGFGTFANSISSSDHNYSSIYSMYGISTRYGFEKGNVLFLSDTYWPSVIGESGILGLVCACGLVYIMLKKGVKSVNKLRKSSSDSIWIIIILSFLALIIESFFTATFFGFRSYVGIILLGMMCSLAKRMDFQEL